MALLGIFTSHTRHYSNLTHTLSQKRGDSPTLATGKTKPANITHEHAGKNPTKILVNQI